MAKEPEDPEEREAHDMVTGFLSSKVIDAQADYLSRGRAYQALSDEDLATQWIASFKAMTDLAAGRTKRAIHADYASEFGLRGLRPPEELVKDDLKRYVDSLMDKLRDLERDDPEAYERLEQELGEDISNYKPSKDDAN
jgi:hypothetical protein